MNMNEVKNTEIWFRTLIELSHMSNNDEYICYTQTKEEQEALLLKFKKPFNNPRIVMSRPVQSFEKLDMKFKGDREKENVTIVTKFLDAYEKIKEVGEFYHLVKETNSNHTISESLAHYIGNAYYDCMSGGCPKVELALLRYLCLNPEIDKKAEVYPGDYDKWITIEEFLEDTKNLNIEIPKELIEMMKIKKICF